MRSLILLACLVLSGCVSADIESQCARDGGWMVFGACQDGSPEARARAMYLAPMLMQQTTQGFQNMQQPLQPYGLPPRSSMNCSTTTTSPTSNWTSCY